MTDRPKPTSAEELRRRRPPNRERVDTIKRAVELEIALRDLRERRGVPQEQVAAHLGTSRPDVSRIEGEDDVRVSTLQRYVAALGGDVELIARFPDGQSETPPGVAGGVTTPRRSRQSSTGQS